MKVFGLKSKTKTKDGFCLLDENMMKSPTKHKQNKIKSQLEINKQATIPLWSKFQTNGPTPLNRTNSFFVKSEQYGGFFIGYGYYNETHYLNDVWFYHIIDNKWTQISLNGETLSNRSEVSATIVGDYLICFGGVCNGEYYDDLHTINIRTGYVRRILTTGDAPSKRKAPVIGTYKNKLFVWGGYDGGFPNDLHILEMDKCVWTKKSTGIKGRYGAATFISKETRIIIFGGSKSDRVIILDMENEKFFSRTPNGTGPISITTNARFVRQGNFAYFIGGETHTVQTPPMEIYALNTNNPMCWYKLDTMPDCKTVTSSEGWLINHENGQKSFGLRRFYGVAAFYHEDRKSICFTLGSKNNSTPYVYSLNISHLSFNAGKENIESNYENN